MIIEHSGRTFESLKSYVARQHNRALRIYIWPADEFIVRHKFTEAQADKIRQLNLNGIEEGSEYRYIRGLPDDFPAEKYMQ